MDIIGRLAIPTTDAGIVSLPKDWDEAHLRAEFSLAGREVEAIRAASADAGAMTQELASRLTLLNAYRADIRSAVVAIVDAQRSDVDALPELTANGGEPDPDPGTEPGEPQPVETPPRAPEQPASAPDHPEQPGFQPVEDREVIIDAEGNRYRRVRVEDTAGAMSPALVASAAAAVRGDGQLPIPNTAEPAGSGVGTLLAPAVPMLAAVGGTLSTGATAIGGEQTSAADVGRQLHRLASSPASGPARVPLFRRDRLAGIPGLERLPADGAVSAQAGELILASQGQHRDALIAAFCGPAELQRDQRFAGPSTARPVAAALGAPIPIGIGVHEFFREMGLADLYAHYTANSAAPTGVGIWTETDQAGVDPTDPATWKPQFSLPGCPTTLKVHAYFLYRALRVQIEDQMSRPQYIDNITVLMEAMLARLAEQALLETFDGWSFQRVMANSTGYGASLQLYYAIRQVLTWATTNTRVDLSGYTLVMPDTLRTLVEIDSFFQGRDAGFAWSELSSQGVGTLITPDFGLEGNPMAPLPVNPYPGAADGSNGSAVPSLPSVYTVRLVNLNDFAWGTAGIEDYGANTSPDLRRQNAVEFFGETAEIAYKRGGNPSFTLTLQGLIANGARPDMVAPFTYGAPVTYANNLPAATPKVASGWPNSQVTT